MPEIKKDLVDDPKDPDKKGDPPAIDPDNPKPEDVKNLQKALSEKDVKLKDAEKVIADAKKIDDDKKTKEEKEKKEKDNKEKSEVEKLKDELKEMREEIGGFNLVKRKEKLEKEYPDIEADLLVGKTDEQIKPIVEKQREKMKKMFGDSKGFIKPKYETVDDIDKEIDEAKKDKTARGDNSAIKVMRLIREKANFNK